MSRANKKRGGNQPYSQIDWGAIGANTFGDFDQIVLASKLDEARYGLRDLDSTQEPKAIAKYNEAISRKMPIDDLASSIAQNEHDATTRKENPMRSAYMTNIAEIGVRMVFGVSASDVFSTMLEALSASRAVRDFSPVYLELLIALFIALGRTADFIDLRKNFHNSSVMKRFDIQGRESLTDEDRWVADSDVNATAYGLLGQLVINTIKTESANSRIGSTKAWAVLSRKVSIYDISLISGVADEDLTEYQKITKEASATITDDDKRIARAFKSVFLNDIANICEALGASSNATSTLINAMYQKRTVKPPK